MGQIVTEKVELVGCPEWTEYEKKNGLDPLGMQTSSVSLYQRLVPGISNVTLRMRYYGYYAWLSRMYAHRVGSTDPVAWQRFVRRAEALYALAAQANNETGVAGVRWAKRVLAANARSHIDFADYAEPGSKTPYLKQPWGAYGAAYGAQLFEIGIFAEASQHEIPVPSPELGDPLADAVDAALRPIANNVLRAIHVGRVARGELKDLAPMLPSAISSNGMERDCYERILFAKTRIQRPSDVSRRQSLLLVLQVIAQLDRTPSATDLRWMLYTGRDSGGRRLDWGASHVAAQRDPWWVYQANDLTHIAYESLLRFALDRLERYPQGIEARVLIQELISDLSTELPADVRNWRDFVAVQASPDSYPEEVLCWQLMRAARPGNPMHEADARTALKLLAIVQQRAESVRPLVQRELEPFDPSTSVLQSLWSELRFLEARAGMTMEHFVAELLERRVIRRHLWVAMRKLRHQGDYTFLIEVDDGRIRVRAKDGPVFTNPRLSTAVAFLQDIHLINEHGLTRYGRKVLANA